MGATRWIDQLAQDLRFALRTLRRSPVFTIVAVLSIGLGIGANTAVFGVINELMLQRLAVRQPGELVQLWRDDGRGASTGLRAVLYGVSPFATAPFVIAIVVLIGAGVIAALLPSRSASRVDPMLAMRSE
jgi:ABC-type antimicrobial peptide transport system permease subunit